MRTSGIPTRLAVVPLALSLMLTACAPPPQSAGTQDQTPSGSTPSPTVSMLLGKAFLEEPITEATLRIYDVSGQLLHEAAKATDKQGYFAIPAPSSLPKDFRVEIVGGTRGGAASDLTLKTDVRNFNPIVDRLYVNAATTLVAAKLDLTPSASLAETQAAVARFLKLPEGFSLGVGLDNPKLKTFDHGTFMTVAGGKGGFSALIASMAPQITGNAITDEDFSVFRLESGAAIAKAIGMELGKGALGKVGGSMMGWALGSLFGSDDGSGARHDEILNEFNDVKNKLNQLSDQMVELQGEINAVKAAIAALGVEMEKQFGLTAYNTKVDALLGSIGTIDALFDSYMDEIMRMDGSEAGKARVDALANDIRSRVPTALATIHLALMGTGGGDGAISQWHRVVSNNNRTGQNGNHYPYLVNASFVNQLNDQLEYFEGVQLRGITLLVEARNFRNDSAGAKIDYDRYMANLEAQKQAIYSPRLSGNVLLSPFTGVMWAKTPYSNGSGVVPYLVENGKLPLEAFYGVHALRTDGYSDWRIPTDLELFYLGANDAARRFADLSASGFDLGMLANGGFTHLLATSNFNNGLSVGMTSVGKLVFFDTGVTSKTAILPARTFKKDPLATL